MACRELMHASRRFLTCFSCFCELPSSRSSQHSACARRAAAALAGLGRRRLGLLAVSAAASLACITLLQAHITRSGAEGKPRALPAQEPLPTSMAPARARQGLPTGTQTAASSVYTTRTGQCACRGVEEVRAVHSALGCGRSLHHWAAPQPRPASSSTGGSL